MVGRVVRQRRRSGLGIGANQLAAVTGVALGSLVAVLVWSGWWELAMVTAVAVIAVTTPSLGRTTGAVLSALTALGLCAAAIGSEQPALYKLVSVLACLLAITTVTIVARRSSEHMTATRERLAVLAWSSRAVHWESNEKTGDLLSIAGDAETLWGHTVEDLMVVDRPSLTHPDDRTVQWIAGDDGPDGVMYRFRRMRTKGGDWAQMLESSQLVSHGGTIIRQGVTVDITPQLQAEAGRELFKTVIDELETAVLLGAREADGRVTVQHANPAVETVLGITATAAVGSELMAVIPWGNDDQQLDRLLETLEGGEPIRQELVEETRRGEQCFFELASYALDETCLAVTVADVTPRGRAQEALRYQAEHDGLTGLHNRQVLLDELARRCDSDGQRAVTLLLVDVDHFKSVNDTFGHTLGDRCLELVADRLSKHSGDGDFVARLGGDEFAVLLGRGRNLADAIGMARRLTALTVTPIDIDGATIQLTMSIGIACSLSNDHATVDAQALLTRADTAMYEAKRSNRNWQVFQQEFDHGREAALALSVGLKAAFDEGQFVLSFQPIIELRTGECHEVEAVLCWEHPTRGLLQPSEFSRLATLAGRGPDLTNRLFELSAEAAASLKSAGLPTRLCVDINRNDIQDRDLPRRLEELLVRHRIKPATLKVEVSEEDLRTASIAAAVSDSIADIGIGITVDNVAAIQGVYDHRYGSEVQTVKLAADALRDLCAVRDDGDRLRWVIESAHHRGLRVVAQDVTDDRTRQLLLECSCDAAQGEALVSPKSKDELVVWLAQESRPAAIVQALT